MFKGGEGSMAVSSAPYDMYGNFREYTKKIGDTLTRLPESTYI